MNFSNAANNQGESVVVQKPLTINNFRVQSVAAGDVLEGGEHTHVLRTTDRGVGKSRLRAKRAKAKRTLRKYADAYPEISKQECATISHAYDQ